MAKQVIIIGNGPSCLEYQFGKSIDSDRFGDVIRINRGYKEHGGKRNIKAEKEVGSKTTIWFCSDLMIDTALNITHPELSKIIVYTPAFKNRYPNGSQLRNITFLPNDYEDAINQIVTFKPQWPSTGIVALAYAIETYDEVLIHGFDAYDFKYDTLHFFEDRPNKYKFSKTIDHSCTSEKEFLSLVQENYNVKQLKDVI